MWKQKAKFIFHTSFVVMLIGASLTRYVGYEGIMHIREAQISSTMISSEPYIIATIKDGDKTYESYFKKEFGAIGDNSFSYDVSFADKKLNISLDSYIFSKKQQALMNIIGIKVTHNDISKVQKIVGRRGVAPSLVKKVQFDDGVKVFLSYGSKILHLPFGIRLNDFILDRYPGSMSPSSYASEVTLIDDKNNNKFDYRIFMNHTLKYGNYQFFQSSYDMDELGTVLSVNNDPGTLPTYIGYFLLALGLFLNMFDKKSRFAKLTKYIKQTSTIAILGVLFFALPHKANATNYENISVDKTALYFDDFRANSLKSADMFAHLITQSNMGRMKPLDTLNHEIVTKLTRKSTFLGLNANQVVLGMLSNPKIWQTIQMIKIKNPKLKKFLNIDKNRNYIAFGEIWDKDGKYKLDSLINEANQMNPNKRGTLQRDVIKLDEKLNIAYMVYYGNLFKIFPKPNTKDNKWVNPLDAMNDFEKKDSDMVKTMIQGFINNIVSANYNEANRYIDLISQYQQKVGKSVIPNKSIIQSEILFNHLSIFLKLTIAYMIIGFVLFFYSFAGVFNKNLISPKIHKLIFIILAVLLALHTFGMAHRWYISGHAPWSDTYESLVYIAWSAMAAGVVFFRRSLLALSATIVMAGIFMFTAHLTGIDPQITNLVPVLKSYWLTIHVSIITGSYGFLAIGAMLGFISLVLFALRDKTNSHIDNTIKQITAINEVSLILGLAMLVVGNFIGGVWANESWGRYWGWDPKETWAYVSIVVYTIVLHLRFIPKLNNQFVFSLSSLLAFGSILMTYFGVNFYLSGMHSYATGDPVPVPSWVYWMIGIVFATIFLASRKKELSS